MSKITILRSDRQLPDERSLAGARELLFGALDGFSADDKRAWRRVWKRLIEAEPGELMAVEMKFPRNGRFHRLHFGMLAAVFDSQERFDNAEQFRIWTEIGAGHCEWVPGPKGAVVPVPKSIAYSKLDDEEFRTVHQNTKMFLRSARAIKVLWPHLSEADRAEMIEVILEGFER